MDYTIVPPQNGKVTIILDWDEAEIVTRLVGMVNSGNLREHSPNLYELMERLNEAFGRNIAHEARRYTASMNGSGTQVYLFDKTDG